MCVAPKPPKPPEAPKVAPSPPPPDTLDQLEALKPQETVLDQALGARLGVNQLRVIPGVTLSKP